MFISHDCQRKFLESLISQCTTVHVYLRSGVKLTGRIIAATDKLIFFNSPGAQVVYKDSISTIIPRAELAINPEPDP